MNSIESIARQMAEIRGQVPKREPANDLSQLPQSHPRVLAEIHNFVTSCTGRQLASVWAGLTGGDGGVLPDFIARISWMERVAPGQLDHVYTSTRDMPLGVELRLNFMSYVELPDLYADAMQVRCDMWGMEYWKAHGIIINFRVNEPL